MTKMDKFKKQKEFAYQLMLLSAFRKTPVHPMGLATIQSTKIYQLFFIGVGVVDVPPPCCKALIFFLHAEQLST